MLKGMPLLRQYHASSREAGRPCRRHWSTAVASDLKSSPVWSFCLIWLQPGPGPVLPDRHLSKTGPGLVWTGPCQSFASKRPVETSCNQYYILIYPNHTLFNLASKPSDSQPARHLASSPDPFLVMTWMARGECRGMGVERRGACW